jgi:hypothetical protein
MRRSVALIGLVVLLAGCSSSSHPSGRPTVSPSLSIPASASVAGPSSPAAPSLAPVPSDSSVVDGITIPPIYTPPHYPVVATPTTCPAAFQTLISTFDKKAPIKLNVQHSQGEITCDYSAPHAPSDGCRATRVIVNTEPDAYAGFYRWIDEGQQNSMWSTTAANAEVPVSGIGTLAEWVSGQQTFETGDPTTWVSIYLTCSHARSDGETLAAALARAGLASTAGEKPES